MPRRKATVAAPVPKPVRRVKSPALMLGIFFLGLSVTVGAVMLGRSDTGQIDVAAVVRNAGTQVNESGETIEINVPSDAFRNMPNGGLVPQTGDEQAAPPTDPAPLDTATSTPESENGETATSTDGAGTNDENADASVTEESSDISTEVFNATTEVQ